MGAKDYIACLKGLFLPRKGCTLAASSSKQECGSASGPGAAFFLEFCHQFLRELIQRLLPLF